MDKRRGDRDTLFSLLDAINKIDEQLINDGISKQSALRAAGFRKIRERTLGLEKKCKRAALSGLRLLSKILPKTFIQRTINRRIARRFITYLKKI